MNPTLAVWRKELLDFLRDRRTVISMLLLPMVVMPMIQIGMLHFFDASRKEAEAKTYPIALQGAGQIDGLEQTLASSGFKPFLTADARKAIDDKRAEAGVIAQGAVVKIVGDYSKNDIMVVRSRIRVALDALRDVKISVALEKAGLSKAVLSPFKIENVNLASTRRMGGKAMGVLLGLMLVVFMFSGGMHPAMDMTAGEKERRTMELLLTSAATRTQIVAGKLLATMTLIVATAALSVVSLGATMRYMLKVPRGGATGLAQVQIDAPAAAMMLMAIIPMALFTSGLMVLTGTRARTGREAASYLTPLMFAGMMLSMLNLLPGLNLGWKLWIIPVANFGGLLERIIGGDWTWPGFLVTMAANGTYAALAFAAAVRYFKDETVLFRT